MRSKRFYRVILSSERWKLELLLMKTSLNWFLLFIAYSRTHSGGIEGTMSARLSGFIVSGTRRRDDPIHVMKYRANPTGNRGVKTHGPPLKKSCKAQSIRLRDFCCRRKSREKVDLAVPRRSHNSTFCNN